MSLTHSVENSSSTPSEMHRKTQMAYKLSHFLHNAKTRKFAAMTGGLLGAIKFIFQICFNFKFKLGVYKAQFQLCNIFKFNFMY